MCGLINIDIDELAPSSSKTVKSPMKANGRIYGDHIVVFALSRDILY